MGLSHKPFPILVFGYNGICGKPTLNVMIVSAAQTNGYELATSANARVSVGGEVLGSKCVARGTH